MSGLVDEGSAFDVRPLYPRLETDPAQPWRARPDWAVSQRLDHPDAHEAGRFALLDLEGGADALTLVSSASRAARGYGLRGPEALAAALAGVELDLVSLRLDAGHAAPAFAAGLVALVEARRLGSAALDIDLGYDPVTLAAQGHAPVPDAEAALVALASKAGLAGRPLLADGRAWHEAGATEAQELALVLATALAHLRTLERAGLTLDAARRAIATLLPFDADVLLGLAKARAMRRLWARLETVCGLEPAPLRLHAETSWRMMTRYDPWTNAMRAGAASFAAGLGGADGITVLPMTLTLGLPDAAARRLARNTGRVLLDECGLGRVDDAAAGAGALEALTEELCRSAWAQFQGIERDGGIGVGLRDGLIQAALRTSAARRAADHESLRRGIVGTSRFARVDIAPQPVLDMSREPDSATAVTIASRRDAEPFEVLRDIAEASAAGGRRPRVFLATLGEPAGFGPRATLAANLLAVVGIGTEPPPATSRGLEKTVAAFLACGASAACLCGDDAACAADGERAISTLRAAGADVLMAVGTHVPGAATLIPDGEMTLQVLRDVARSLAAGSAASA